MTGITAGKRLNSRRFPGATTSWPSKLGTEPVRKVSVDPSDTAGRLAIVSRDLDAAGGDPASILGAATSSLSRIKPATWVGVVMNRNPDTCWVAVANDTDQAMADWVDDYLAALERPNQAATDGLALRVIASGEPIVITSVPYEEFLVLLSPACQAFCRSNPPPNRPRVVACLIVPMQVGGATIGTLCMFDWRHDNVVVRDDLSWVQPVADRIALSLEHSRLLRTVHVDTQRMELVRALALASRHGQDLRVTLGGIVELVKGQLPVDAAEILLFSDGGNVFTVAASAGFRSPWPAEYPIPISTARRSTDGWQPRVEYLAELGSGGPRRSNFAREGFLTFVRVPLHANNRLVGALELYSRSVVEWDAQSLDFFDILGGLLGAAIGHVTAHTPAQMAERMAGSSRPDLSQLELDILRLIGEGLTNQEIADHLYRSPNTIKFHVRRILEKSGAVNRTDLARRATRDGWL